MQNIGQKYGKKGSKLQKKVLLFYQYISFWNRYFLVTNTFLLGIVILVIFFVFRYFLWESSIYRIVNGGEGGGDGGVY